MVGAGFPRPQWIRGEVTSPLPMGVVIHKGSFLIFCLYTFSPIPDTLCGLVKQCSSEVGGMYARSDLEFLA